MIWYVISFDSWTHLVVISCTVEAQLFDDILQHVMLPFLLRLLGLIIQHDNAQPHKVRVAMNCLKLALCFFDNPGHLISLP